MVLKRQQQRRQAVTNEQNASPGSDGSRPILSMGDPENSEERPRDTLPVHQGNLSRGVWVIISVSEVNLQ